MDPLGSIAAATQEAQMLYELTQDLGNSLSLQEALAFVGVRLKRLIPYETIAIYIRREEKLIPEYVSGENLRLFTSLEIPVGQGLSGWVAETTSHFQRQSFGGGRLSERPTKYSTLRSALAVPLNGVTGLLGVLALYRAERDAFSRENLRILVAICPKWRLQSRMRSITGGSRLPPRPTISPTRAHRFAMPPSPCLEHPGWAKWLDTIIAEDLFG